MSAPVPVYPDQWRVVHAGGRFVVDLVTIDPHLVRYVWDRQSTSYPNASAAEAAARREAATRAETVIAEGRS